MVFVPAAGSTRDLQNKSQSFALVDPANDRKIMTTTEITIKGMTCGHCAASVTKELEAITGVTGVQVDQPGGKAQVESTNVTHEQMAEAVEEAGYEALEFAASNG